MLEFLLDNILAVSQLLADCVQSLLVVDVSHQLGAVSQQLLPGGQVQVELHLLGLEVGEQLVGGVRHVGWHEALDSLAVQTTGDVGQHGCLGGEMLYLAAEEF